MNFSKFVFIIFLSILSSLGLTVYAEESLADLVRKKADISKAAAQNSQSTSNIPGYSEEEKQNTESHLNSMQVGADINQLKNEGAKLREKEVQDNPDGAIASMVEATNLKRTKGFESYAELEMFKQADKYMQDPVAQMNLINKVSCKEQINNKKKGFYRKEKKETVTDEIEEFQSCEVPIHMFKCKKTLEVSCKKTAECDYGGIQEGSAKIEGGNQDDPSKVFRFDGENLNIGVDGNNYFQGYCKTFDKSFVFNIENKDLITTFQMVYASFDDYFQLKLNGHTFYVGPDGGTHVEVQNVGSKFFKHYEVFNGHTYRNCERGRHWNIKQDIDLRSYLKEGKNILDMRVIVSGDGKGFLQIKVKKKCCASNDWKQNWVEHCEQIN